MVLKNMITENEFKNRNDKITDEMSVELYRLVASSVMVDDYVFDQYAIALSNAPADITEEYLDLEMKIKNPFHIFQLPATEDPRDVIDFLMDDIRPTPSIYHDIALFITKVPTFNYDVV